MQTFIVYIAIQFTTVRSSLHNFNVVIINNCFVNSPLLSVPKLLLLQYLLVEVL